MNEARQRIVQLLRNLLVVGAGNYGAMVVSLGINAALTRTLGVEAFGQLALLLTASQVIALLGTNWTLVALVRFGAQEFALSASVAEAFWARVWIVAPSLAVGAGLMVLGGPLLAAYLMIPAWGILIVLLHFTAVFLLMTIGAVFQARNQMRAYGVVLFMDKAVMAGLLVALFGTSLAVSPLAVLGLYAISSASVALWALGRLGRSLLPVVFNRAVCRRMVVFSLPLLLSSWVGLFGSNWFDLVIIKKFRPLSEVGLYSLGAVLAGVVQQVTIIFSTLLLPQFSVMVGNGELDKIRSFVDRILPYWFFTTTVLFTVVLFGAAPIVPVIFGRAFAPAASVLAVLMAATCGLALFNAFSPLLSAFGATWPLTGIAVTSGFVNVMMDLLLIPAYGIHGAAVATVVAYGTSAVLVLWYVQTRLGQNVFRLGLLTLPVVISCGCFLALDPFHFYLVAIPSSAVSMFWLMRRFHLFRGDDAVFLKDLRFPVPLATEAPIR